MAITSNTIDPFLNPAPNTELFLKLEVQEKPSSGYSLTKNTIDLKLNHLGPNNLLVWYKAFELQYKILFDPNYK